VFKCQQSRQVGRVTSNPPRSSQIGCWRKVTVGPYFLKIRGVAILSIALIL